MIAVVGHPDVVLFVYPETVRIPEHALAPGSEVLSLSIEHDERIGLGPPLEHVDFAGGVRGNGRDASEFPAGGHGVRFFSEADIYFVFEQSAFVVIPAGLGGKGERGEQEKAEGRWKHGADNITAGLVVGDPLRFAFRLVTDLPRLRDQL